MYKYKNPRIKPIYPVYRLNSVEFRIGAQLGITAEFEDPDGELWELVSRLDGRKLSEIIIDIQSIFPNLTAKDIVDAIDLLDEEGFIEETLSECHIDNRYIPNINYFSRYLSSKDNRYNIQNKINKSTILLLGLGGGGSNILTMLAGLGPKKVIVIDYDKVEESNLGRQLLFKEKDIGKYKVDVAVKAFREMNSQIEIEGYIKKITTTTDITNLLDNDVIDLVICAIDEPPFLIQRIVNQAIVSRNIPCVFGASQVSRGRVFTVIPNKTGCFDCLNIYYSKGDPQFIEQFIAFRNINFNPPSIAYAPAIFLLTAVIVDEAIKVLTGYSQPSSLGTQYEVNFENHSAFCHPTWKKFEECPVCGSGNSKDWEIFKYYDNE